MIDLCRIAAVVFDMDGTLVDSEPYTSRAVEQLLAEQGIARVDIDPQRLHGITWQQIAALLVGAHPDLADQPLAGLLQQRFQRLFADHFPPEIPGARRFFLAASRALPAAIVSSSHRETVATLIARWDLRAHCRLTVCAEDCTRSKPDPQCYLVAAERLGCAPSRCLAFEDSLAGLQAARAAGMRTVAITHGKQDELLRAARALADTAIADYTELPPGLFASITGELSDD